MTTKSTKRTKRVDPKAEQAFRDIVLAASHLRDLVASVKPRHAKHVMAQMERLTYEATDGADDDAEFGDVGMDVLPYIDAARERLGVERDLPCREHDQIVHRHAVAAVAKASGVTIDPCA